ncbi:MAG: RNA polymerase sigma factor [Hespellia sp.]|jgi:RNA polymerase sigma factor (sigma-70 family)|nr:RNA polymerase sigma factor [Hespellia sp.]
MYRYEEPDKIWIQKASRGDVKAFAHLYSMIYQDLYRFALYMMRHPQDAEDMVSEAVIAAYRNIKKLRKEEAFRSWMFQILSNCCKRRLRALQREAEFSGQTWEEAGNQISASEIDYAENQDVQDAFLKLSEEERSIVGLSVFGGYNSNEIGTILSLNPTTVRSKRSRALQKMKGRLGKECLHES